MQEFFANVLQRLASLQLGFKNIIELLILAYIIYHILVWVKNTRTWFLLRGIVVLLVFIILANVFSLNVIVFLAEKTLSVLVIALLIIFAPELRNALEQLGQSNYLMRFLSPGRQREETLRHTREATAELVKAAFAMAKTKTGALIVIERELSLEEYAKTGIPLDAVVSSALLINIFEKNTPLHDGAVVLRGNRVVAATCYLPLSANPEINKAYGTRHRAAIGVSENSDSLTIVVSEETGEVSLAEGGKLYHGLTPDELQQKLSELEKTPVSSLQKVKNRKKNRKKQQEGKEEADEKQSV